MTNITLMGAAQAALVSAMVTLEANDYALHAAMQS
jgi:hypothetical protein